MASSLEPQIASKVPFPLELKSGRYSWCACGRSQQQPFCDGSHQGSAFEPIVFEVEQPRDGVLWLCGCKQSRRKPFCDGRHNKLK